jgi:hypothetical protein
MLETKIKKSYKKAKEKLENARKWEREAIGDPDHEYRSRLASYIAGMEDILFEFKWLDLP